MSETIVVAIIVIGGFALWWAMHREGRLRYRKKAMLAGCELEFFHRLRQALPECVIAPQVGLGALIEPVGIGRGRQSALALIAFRRAGYAVFDEQMQLLTIVELDHHARPRRADIKVERYLGDAGIRTVRFSAKHPPSDTRIRNRIFTRTQLQMPRNSRPVAGSEPDIEFEHPKSPWRNTLNAHS
jgi:hypothetical protein